MNTPFKLDLDEIADAAQAFRNALLDLMPFVAGQHAEKLVNDELARYEQLIDLCVKKEIVEPLLLGGNSSARVYGVDFHPILTPPFHLNLTPPNAV
jgi:hypothetical protein